MTSTKYLYIGSNIEFGRSLLSKVNTLGTDNNSLCLSTDKFTIVSCISEILRKGELNFDVYIVQLETRFRDHQTMGESPGLLLIKHILLTEELLELRRKKIIALSFFSSHYHIKKSADNVVLLSPYVELLDIILNVERASKKIILLNSQFVRDFEKEEEHFETNLNNYIIWTIDGKDCDEIQFKHESQNFLGIKRIFRELLSEEEYEKKILELKTRKDFNRENDQLYNKKKQFKHKLRWRKFKENKEEYDEFRKNIFKIKEFELHPLIIDDKDYWHDFFNDFIGGDNAIHLRNMIEFDNFFNDIKKEYKDKYREAIIFDSVDSFHLNRAICPYNIVFLDLNLSEQKKVDIDVSGIIILRKLKEINPCIPIIIFTASEDPKNIQKVVKLGCNGYFIKDRDNLLFLSQMILNEIRSKEYLFIGEYLYFLKQINSESKKEFIVPQFHFHNNDDFLYSSENKVILTIRKMPNFSRMDAVGIIESNLKDITETEVIFKNIYEHFFVNQSKSSELYNFFLSKLKIYSIIDLFQILKGYFNENQNDIDLVIEKEFTIKGNVNVSKYANTRLHFESYKPVQALIEEITEQHCIVNIINSTIRAKILRGRYNKIYNSRDFVKYFSFLKDNNEFCYVIKPKFMNHEDPDIVDIYFDRSK